MARNEGQFAFISYGTYAEAENAIRQLDGKAPLNLKVQFRRRKVQESEDHEPGEAVPQSDENMAVITPQSLMQHEQALPKSITYCEYNTTHDSRIDLLRNKFSPHQYHQHHHQHPIGPSYSMISPHFMHYPYDKMDYADTNALWSRGSMTVDAAGHRHITMGRGHTSYSISEPRPRIINDIGKIYENRHPGCYKYGSDDCKEYLGECVHCSRHATLCCSICETFYCSRACQIADWPKHQERCTKVPPLVGANSHHRQTPDVRDSNTCLVDAEPIVEKSMEISEPSYPDGKNQGQAEVKVQQPTLRRPKSVADNLIKIKTDDVEIREKKVTAASITVPLQQPPASVTALQTGNDKNDGHINDGHDTSKVQPIVEEKMTIHPAVDNFLSASEFIEVLITSVRETGKLFSVQKIQDTERIAQLMDKLNENIQQFSIIERPIIGETYGVIYDNVWHRGLVVSLNPLLVDYIDWGTIEELPANGNSFKAIGDFATEPPRFAQLIKMLSNDWHSLEADSVISVKKIKVEIENDMQVITVEVLKEKKPVDNSVPVKAPEPVQVPAPVKVQTPVPAPVKVAASVKVPTPVPVKAAAPVKVPTPVPAPVKLPTPVQVQAPVKVPTPVPAPVKVPTPAPVKVAAPVPTPTPAPAPIASPPQAPAPAASTPAPPPPTTAAAAAEPLQEARRPPSVLTSVTVGTRMVGEIGHVIDENTARIVVSFDAINEIFEALLNPFKDDCDVLASTSINYKPHIDEFVAVQKPDDVYWVRGYVLKYQSPSDIEIASLDEGTIITRAEKIIPLIPKYNDMCMFSVMIKMNGPSASLQVGNVVELEVTAINSVDGLLAVEVTMHNESIITPGLQLHPWTPWTTDIQLNEQGQEKDKAAMGMTKKIVERIELKNNTKVVIQSYRNPHVVFLRSLEPEEIERLQALTQHVAKCALTAQPLTSFPQAADYVLAQFVDDNYYRTMVIAAEADVGKIKVFYIDYGDVQVTTMDKLKIMPESLMDEPCGVKKVRLHNVKVAPPTQEALDYLAAAVTNEEQFVCQVESSVNNEDHVTLISAIAPAGSCNLNDHVNTLLTPQWERQANASEESPSTLPLAKEIEPRKSFTLNDMQPGHLGKVGESTTALFLETIVPGGKYVFGPDDREMIVHLASVMPEMMKKYGEATNHYIPRDNELCIALFEDENWYRGCCFDSKATPDSSIIFFLDFGNTSIVPHTNIREMTNDFLKPEAFGCICSVHDFIDPATSEVAPQVLARLETLLLPNETYKVEIVSSDGDEYEIKLPEIRATLVAEGLLSA